MTRPLFILFLFISAFVCSSQHYQILFKQSGKKVNDDYVFSKWKKSEGTVRVYLQLAVITDQEINIRLTIIGAVGMTTGVSPEGYKFTAYPYMARDQDNSPLLMFIVVYENTAIHDMIVLDYNDYVFRFSIKMQGT